MPLRVQDPLKELSEICQPDERQQHFVGDIRDWHAELSRMILHEGVPASTRQLFETAKNLSLYSWFVYRFHPIGELAGWLALENALLEKLAQKGQREVGTKRSPGLKKLLELAIAERWLVEESIPDRMAMAKERVIERKWQQAPEEGHQIAEPTDEEIAREAESMRLLPAMCAAAARLRNSIAHGNEVLHPNSRRTLRVTAGLINQLFNDSGAGR